MNPQSSFKPLVGQEHSMKTFAITDEAEASIKEYADEWAREIELRALGVAQGMGVLVVTEGMVQQAVKELRSEG